MKNGRFTAKTGCHISGVKTGASRRKREGWHLCLGMWTPFNTQMPWSILLTPQMAVQSFLHFQTTMAQSLHWLNPQNCLFPWGNRQPHLPVSSLDPDNLPSQMAYRSNQPFFYNTPDRLRQTDRQMVRVTSSVPIPLKLY